MKSPRQPALALLAGYISLLLLLPSCGTKNLNQTFTPIETTEAASTIAGNDTQPIGTTLPTLDTTPTTTTTPPRSRIDVGSTISGECEIAFPTEPEYDDGRTYLRLECSDYPEVTFVDATFDGHLDVYPGISINLEGTVQRIEEETTMCMQSPCFVAVVDAQQPR